MPFLAYGSVHFHGILSGRYVYEVIVRYSTFCHAVSNFTGKSITRSEPS
jgi:hypothetical protein